MHAISRLPHRAIRSSQAKAGGKDVHGRHGSQASLASPLLRLELDVQRLSLPSCKMTCKVGKGKYVIQRAKHGRNTVWNVNLHLCSSLIGLASCKCGWTPCTVSGMLDPRQQHNFTLSCRQLKHNFDQLANKLPACIWQSLPTPPPAWQQLQSCSCSAPTPADGRTVMEGVNEG